MRVHGRRAYRWVLAGLLAGAPLGTIGAARAQVVGEPPAPYPEPDKFAQGLYGEAAAGALVFVGEDAGALGAGPSLGVRLGYDLVRWVALQVHGSASSHETSFAGPQGTQLLQIYQGSGELKLTLPLGQWSLFAFGGGGAARLSTNLLGTAGLTSRVRTRVTPLYLGGAGFDYHTLSRHFSFGLRAAYVKHTRIATPGAAAVDAYVRFTF